MAQLCERSCKACRGDAPRLAGPQARELMEQLQGWDLVEEHHLRKTFKFPDFATALAYVNRVGELAERENHHPNIFLTWGRVRIELCTHKVEGLTEGDFILAAKIDTL